MEAYQSFKFWAPSLKTALWTLDNTPAAMTPSSVENYRDVLLRRDNSSICDPLEAMLVPSSSQSAFHELGSGPKNMTGLEATILGNGRKRPHYATGEGSEDTTDDDEIVDFCIQQTEKKRRLTSEQVKLLERSFELENKPEYERKVQLAKDLNMQPRQVAVWFQNRRARWKTKQLEKDYSVLKHNYKALKASYDTLLQEKKSLQEKVRCISHIFRTTQAASSSNSPMRNAMNQKYYAATTDVSSLTTKLDVGNANLLESHCSSRCQDSVIPSVGTVEAAADMAIFAQGIVSAVPQAYHRHMVKAKLVEDNEAYSYHLTPEDHATFPWWITSWADD